MLSLLAGKRVLLADANRDERQSSANWLKKAGMLTTLADKGEDAIEIAACQSFDAILIDEQLPETGGLAVARHLQQLGIPGLKLTLLAAARGDEKETVLDPVYDGFLMKPVQPALLLGVLTRLLSALGHAYLASKTTVYDLLSDADRSAYRSELPARIQAIQDALALGDLATVTQLAHKLSGSAGSFGLPYLGETASRLVKAIREGQSLLLLQELSGELVAVVQRLKAD